MKVLVTGANGFLGRHVVNRLCDEGYRVRAMVRPGAPQSWQDHPNVELYRAQLTEKADLAKAVKDCSAVLHCAADTRQSHRHLKDYWPANVTASLELYRAALQSGVDRFVFVSSANTMGYGEADQPGHEDLPPVKLFLRSGYARSKIAAEQALMDLDEQHLVIVNPTFLIGPDDARSGSEMLLKQVLGRKFLFIPKGGKNFVDVRDAALGVIRAMEKGEAGSRYLLCGENKTFGEFYAGVVKQNNQFSYFLPIPKSVLLLAGYFGSMLRGMGMRISLNLNNARILCIRNFYSNARAVGELKLNFRKLESTVEDILEWRNVK